MSTDKINCQICGAATHAIQIHLKTDHPEMTVADYTAQFPDAPIMSEFALKKLEAKKAEAAAVAEAAEKAAAAETADETATTTTTTPTVTSMLSKSAKDNPVKKPLDVVFNLTGKGSKNREGKAIPITVYENPTDVDMIPAINNTYVYEIDDLKHVLMALEFNINPYVWGHKGSGKTEMFEQIAARTGRPIMRVQHTANTEEAHIVGQWTVKDGATIFELGPLPMAMKMGWLYMADEYDFALPSVLSVYQAVLEGKALVIKEADKHNRIIQPHPNFRFCATGNTNGSGDETGLYQGTNLQNSANFDRFGMCIHKQYMKKADESQILQLRLGLVKEDADKMVEFANLVRSAYDGSKISDIISPRALINAARIGSATGDFKKGIGLAFTNKLTRVDSEAVSGICQRVFG